LQGINLWPTLDNKFTAIITRQVAYRVLLLRKQKLNRQHHRNAAGEGGEEWGGNCAKNA